MLRRLSLDTNKSSATKLFCLKTLEWLFQHLGQHLQVTLGESHGSDDSEKSKRDRKSYLPKGSYQVTCTVTILIMNIKVSDIVVSEL